MFSRVFSTLIMRQIIEIGGTSPLLELFAGSHLGWMRKIDALLLTLAKSSCIKRLHYFPGRPARIKDY